MTEERLKELIPELNKYTFVSHDKIIAIEGENTWLEDDSAYGEFSKYTESLKQTEQLRECVTALISSVTKSYIMEKNLCKSYDINRFKEEYKNDPRVEVLVFAGVKIEEIMGGWVKTIKDIVERFDIPRGSIGGTVNKIKKVLGIEGVLDVYNHKRMRQYTEEEYNIIVQYLEQERKGSSRLGLVYKITKEQTNTTQIPKIEKNREKGFYHRLTRYGGIR